MKKDILANSLDIEPLEGQVVEFITPSDENQVETDFIFARDNMYDVINKAQDAVNDFADVAKQSQHPRAYEVLNAMFKTISDMSTNLIAIQKTKKEVFGKIVDIGNSPSVTNNNLFVGSTAELLSKLEEMKKARTETHD